MRRVWALLFCDKPDINLKIGGKNARQWTPLDDIHHLAVNLVEKGGRHGAATCNIVT